MTEMSTEEARIECLKDVMSRMIADSAERFSTDKVKHLLEIQTLRRQLQELTERNMQLELLLAQAKQLEPTSALDDHLVKEGSDA